MSAVVFFLFLETYFYEILNKNLVFSIKAILKYSDEKCPHYLYEIMNRIEELKNLCILVLQGPGTDSRNLAEIEQRN